MSEMNHVTRLSGPQRLQLAVQLCPLFQHGCDWSDMKNDCTRMVERSYQLADAFIKHAEALHAEAVAKDLAEWEKDAPKREKAAAELQAKREAQRAEAAKPDMKIDLDEKT